MLHTFTFPQQLGQLDIINNNQLDMYLKILVLNNFFVNHLFLYSAQLSLTRKAEMIQITHNRVQNTSQQNSDFII